jgi:fluoroquinolone transport system permease protein
MRWGLPFARDVLIRELSFDLSQYYNLIMSIVILITPMMMGMLSGFLILDERDENILTFYSVTPISKSGYLFYRVAMPTVISFVLSFFVFYFIGIVECRIELLIPVLLLCALESPMMALFLGAFASNKVEGLALTKAFGILFLAPMAGYFIKSNWHYAVGIAPTYWVSKALLAGIEMSGGYWTFVVVGAVVHLLIIGLLLRRFENLYI